MIVTSIDQIQKVIPNVDSSMEFADFETFMNDAERYCTRELLGNSTYSLLETDSDTYEDAVQLLEQVIILKGYYEAIPFLDLQMTQSGFAVTNNKNMSPASKDRVLKLRKQTYTRFHYATEDLLQYLQETTALHDTWKSSTVFSKMYELFVATAREVSEYVEINDNRDLYKKIRGNILNAQRFLMSKVLSKDLIDLVIEQRKDDDLTDENKDIVSDLQGASVNLGFYDAINRLSITIDERGVMIPYEMGASTTASLERLEELKLYYKNTGYDYLGNVMKVINAADPETSYQAYYNSDEYKNRDTGYKNEKDSPMFVFGG